jgi:hypothetical protein
MILITGCARSGTRYASCWWGLGHENLNDKGIASWFLAHPETASNLPPWHGAVRDVEFDTVVHLTRHPLEAIASMTALSAAAWAWLQRYTTIDPQAPILDRAMSYWLQWNRMAAQRARDAARGISPLHVESLQHSDLPTNINTRTHDAVAWQELEMANGLLKDAVCSLGEEYGYRCRD